MILKLLRNDILRQMISPDSFSLLFFSDSDMVRGKHASVQLIEIFQKNAFFVRIAGLILNRIQSIEELDQICENLLITKIEYIEEKNQNVYSSNKLFEEKITVPINKPIYEFCYEINRYIREYQTFLKEKGVDKPLAVRKEFPDFVMNLRNEYNPDQQQILIRKAIELINFLSIKELVESSGPLAAISYMERLSRGGQTESEDRLSTLITKFSRTPVFSELLTEIRKLSTNTQHPKLERLKELLIALKTKTGFKRFYIIAN